MLLIVVEIVLGNESFVFRRGVYIDEWSDFMDTDKPQGKTR
jgi:hypothetical protein